MARDVLLDDELVAMYAGALYTIARSDRVVERDESQRLQELVAQRWRVTIDPIELFFTTVTPESFATALRRTSSSPFRTSGLSTELHVGRALVEDAVDLTISTGTLSDNAALTILRYARALGCTTADIQSVTGRLAAWLD
jgi:hypothetical protein